MKTLRRKKGGSPKWLQVLSELWKEGEKFLEGMVEFRDEENRAAWVREYYWPRVEEAKERGDHWGQIINGLDVSFGLI